MEPDPLAARDHPSDAIQEAVDGRLSPEDRAALDRHLEGCEACRREWQTLTQLKRRLAALRIETSPDDVLAAARLRFDEAASSDVLGAARPASSNAPSPSVPRRASGSRWWTTVAAALALAALGAAWFVWTRPSTAIPSLAMADHERSRIDPGDVMFPERDPTALERRLREAEPRIDARVFDFGMMGLDLVGGGTRHLGGRSVSFSYRDASGRLVMCQMYVGHVDALPDTADRRAINGIEFRIFQGSGVTAVFWQEGPTVCVLTADGDRESALALAVAKARRL